MASLRVPWPSLDTSPVDGGVDDGGGGKDTETKTSISGINNADYDYNFPNSPVTRRRLSSADAGAAAAAAAAAASASKQASKSFTLVVRLPEDLFELLGGDVTASTAAAAAARDGKDGKEVQKAVEVSLGGGLTAREAVTEVLDAVDVNYELEGGWRRRHSFLLVVNGAEVPESTILSDIGFMLNSVKFVELRSVSVPNDVREACAQVLSRGLAVGDLFVWPAQASAEAFGCATVEDDANRRPRRNSRLKNLTLRKRSSKGKLSAEHEDGAKRDVLVARLASLKEQVNTIELCSTQTLGQSRRAAIWNEADISAVAMIIVIRLFERKDPFVSRELLERSECFKIARSTILDGAEDISKITAPMIQQLFSPLPSADRALLFLVLRTLFLFSREGSTARVNSKKVAAVFAPLIFGGARLPDPPAAQPITGRFLSARPFSSSDTNLLGSDDVPWVPIAGDESSATALLMDIIIGSLFESIFMEEIFEEERKAQLPLWRGSLLAHSNGVHGMKAFNIGAASTAILTWSSEECRLWEVPEGSITPKRLGSIVKNLSRAEPILDLAISRDSTIALTDSRHGAYPRSTIDVWIARVKVLDTFRLHFHGTSLGKVELVHTLSVSCRPLLCNDDLVFGAQCAPDQIISIWKSDDQSLLKNLSTPRPVSALLVVSDRLWGGTEDGGVCVWEIEGETVVKTFCQIPGASKKWKGSQADVASPHTMKIRSMVYVAATSQKGPAIWTGGSDGLICRWDALEVAPLDYFQASKSRVSLTSELGFVWCSTWEGTVQVLTASGKLSVELDSHHSDGVNALLFFFDRLRGAWKFLVSSYDHSISVWVVPRSFGKSSALDEFVASAHGDAESPTGNAETDTIFLWLTSVAGVSDDLAGEASVILRKEGYDSSESLRTLDSVALSQMPGLKVRVRQLVSDANLSTSSRNREELDQRWRIDSVDLQVGKELGSGAFGIVYKGSYKGNDCVIKTFRANSAEKREEMLVEALTLSRLRPHASICAFFGVMMENDRPPCLVLEYIDGGDLSSVLMDMRQTLTGMDIVAMAKDLAAGVQALHDNNQLHLDLAPRNLLVVGVNPLRLRITDFGLSRSLSRGQEQVSAANSPLPWRWVDPEVVRTRQFSKASDRWSYAVCVWEMMCRKRPYEDIPTSSGVLEFVLAGGVLPTPFYPLESGVLASEQTVKLLSSVLLTFWRKRQDSLRLSEVVERLADILRGGPRVANCEVQASTDGQMLSPIKLETEDSSYERMFHGRRDDSSYGLFEESDSKEKTVEEKKAAEFAPTGPTDLRCLSIDGLALHLSTLGISGPSLEALRHARIDGSVLGDLDKDAIVEIGVALVGDRIKLLKLADTIRNL